MKAIRFVSRWLGYIAAVILGIMMMLTVVDVFFRYVLNAPLTGAIEVSELLMVVLVFPALGWIAIERSHIRVDLLVSTWPPRVQLIVEIIILLLTLGTFVIITWQSILESSQVDMTTSLLSIPEAPFHWVMTVGFAMLCLAIVSLVVEDVASLGEQKREGKRR
ncbi:MAG: TRAP transporter small permease [Deltaproteobacteria bacterium]|nr:MAG: TRAP transporter small permease [Deltaproteobacteria bacterium]